MSLDVRHFQRSVIPGRHLFPNDVSLTLMNINVVQLQYNHNGSNTDCSITVDDSNSFFSLYKILPIAQENKYLGIFPYFIMELYVVCTH